MPSKSTLFAMLMSGAAACALPASGLAGTYPPPALTNGAYPNPGLIITFNADGSVTATGTGNPYAVADEYIEIINDRPGNLTALNLATPGGAEAGIFAFEGRGIDYFGGGWNARDTTGFGGADAYFTNISSTRTTGTVDFIGNGIDGGGGEGYFSVRGMIDVDAIVSPIEEPASMAMLGIGLAGLLVVRRRTS